MRYSKIEIGQRIGMYTVIEPAEPDRAKRRKWICRCDCGKIKSVYDLSLKKGGGVVGCGCGRSPDLSGQRFGRLTVLERSGKYASRGKKKVPLWKCVCDCGSITYKSTDILRNHRISMCQRCAGLYLSNMGRAAAGFVDGTQLAMIKIDSSASNNNTGVRGVYFDSRRNKYQARLRFQGKMHNLGSFNTLQEAAKARKVAEEEIFGKFLETLDAQAEEKGLMRKEEKHDEG